MPPCKLRGNHGPLLDRQGWWVGREWPTGCIAPDASAGPAKPEPDLRGLRAGCQPGRQTALQDELHGVAPLMPALPQPAAFRQGTAA